MLRSHDLLRSLARVLVAAALALVAGALPLAAQACYTESDMDASTSSALQSAAARYFQYAANGDYANLRQNSSPAVASSFNGIVAAIGDSKANLQGAQASVRGAYMLEAGSKSAQARFFCGVVGMPDSVAFFLPNLPAGRYAVVIQDVKGGKVPIAFTQILQQAGSAWQLAGLYMRPLQIAGRDGNWYLTKAREYKSRGQTHNAWFYYLTAWDLLAPVNFMGSPPLDKVADEMQAVRPGDLPVNNTAQDLLAGGKTFKLTQMFPTPVGDALDLVVKYQTPSVSDSTQSFADNTAVIKALVSKYPELRDAFGAVVARAVAPNGEDYGTVLAMKDVK